MTTPRVHQLKTSDGFFSFIWSGQKTFEIRKNDRDFKPGDHVVLAEIRIVQAPPSPYGIVEYTGREVVAQIIYLTDFHQKDGYVVFAFREISRRPSTI